MCSEQIEDFTSIWQIYIFNHENIPNCGLRNDVYKTQHPAFKKPRFHYLRLTIIEGRQGVGLVPRSMLGSQREMPQRQAPKQQGAIGTNSSSYSTRRIGPPSQQ